VEAFRRYSAAAAAAVVVLCIRYAEEHRSYSLATAEVVAAIVRPVAVGSSGIHFRCPRSTREPRRLAPSSAERS
jgi:hypothetical protein